MSPEDSQQTPGAGGSLVFVDPQRTACDPRWYISPDAVLQIQMWNSVPGVTVNVNIYQLDSTGRVIRAQQVISPTSTRALNSVIVPMAEGFLIGLTCFAGTATQPGQLFVRIVITQGNPTTPQPMVVVCQGYVTNLNRLYGPGAYLSRTTEGRGNFRSVQGSLPAAGADILETVPTGAIWRLVSMNYSLVTGAAVANRLSGFVIDDGSNIVMNLGSQGNAVATNTYIYNAVNGANLINAAQPPTNWPIPRNFWMPAGYRMRTLTTNIQAADQFSAPNYVVEEFING